MHIRTRKAWLLTVIAALEVPALVPGCHDPLAQSRTARREASLRHTIDVAVRREQRNESNLRDTLQVIRLQQRRDTENLQRSLRSLQTSWRNEVRRFQERQTKYRQMIMNQAAGQPEHIPETWIRMIF